MSQLTNQSGAQPPREPSKAWKLIVQAGKIVLNNWPTKLLALVLAIVLWAGLITQDPSLTRERVFRDVAVSVNGSDTLKRNGLIVTSDLDALLDGVSVTVDVPQMQYNNATASNFNIRVDLTRIKEAGEQEISILTTNSSTYGKVTEIEPATVTVMVEDYISEGFIPVNVLKVGEPPVGYYASEPTCDPARITVSGPRSLVERVDRAEVVLDQSMLPAREGAVEKAAEFVLLDARGEEIASDMLQVTSDSVLRTRINVAVQMYTERTISLLEGAVLYTGKPMEGYEVTEVIVFPESITVAGKKSIIESIRTVNARTPLSITGKKETVSGTIEMRTLMNVAAMSATQAEVTVVIEPIREEKVFRAVPLTITNVPDGMTAAGPYTATVTVTGPQNWVADLKKADLSVTCDVAGLEPGVHELPLCCTIEGSEGESYTVDIEPMNVRVTIVD